LSKIKWINTLRNIKTFRRNGKSIKSCSATTMLWNEFLFGWIINIERINRIIFWTMGGNLYSSPIPVQKYWTGWLLQIPRSFSFFRCHSINYAGIRGCQAPKSISLFWEALASQKNRCWEARTSQIRKKKLNFPGNYDFHGFERLTASHCQNCLICIIMP
jgi:hypothetical protein